jgi:hypothetical protein
VDAWHACWSCENGKLANKTSLPSPGDYMSIILLHRELWGAEYKDRVETKQPKSTNKERRSASLRIMYRIWDVFFFASRVCFEDPSSESPIGGRFQHTLTSRKTTNWWKTLKECFLVFTEQQKILNIIKEKVTCLLRRMTLMNQF